MLPLCPFRASSSECSHRRPRYMNKQNTYVPRYPLETEGKQPGKWSAQLARYAVVAEPRSGRAAGSPTTVEAGRKRTSRSGSGATTSSHTGPKTTPPWLNRNRRPNNQKLSTRNKWLVSESERFSTIRPFYVSCARPRAHGAHHNDFIVFTAGCVHLFQLEAITCAITCKSLISLAVFHI